MKICFNFVGQPKNIYNLQEMYNSYLHDPVNECYILYTTWKTEDTTEFQTIFPNAYIHLIDIPNEDENSVFKNLITNYELDITNIRNGNFLKHTMLGFYCRDYSRHTIIQYENINHIKFDIIITLRPDIKLKQNIFVYYNDIFDDSDLKLDISPHYDSIYNDFIYSDKKHILFVGNDPCWDVYYEGAYPAALSISKRDDMIYLLDFMDILHNCTLHNKNIFHPETAYFKIVQQKKLNIVYLPFYSFMHYSK